MDKTFNTIQQGDCIAGMNRLAAESVDLAFADPPFNIGYEYDVYQDKLGREKYLDWSREWITGVHRVLKPDGTFWLAIGDEYAAELKVLSQEVGFHTRSWVVWYYTFGVNCKNKFTRSHAHIFYFVKDPDNFTFRSEDLENRIPSARELVYNDKRANPNGRLPDDTWMIRPADVVGEIIADDGTWSPEDIKPERDTDQTWILRPQDIENCFQPDENTWYFPRVAGTFKERQGFHGCQMPEQLLGRIIRSCSNDGELVLDPFSGSATTLAVAKKLNRRYIGFELSEEYADYGRERLEQIRIGDPLNGSAEPTKSAPKTSSKSKPGRSKNESKSQQKEFAYDQQIAASQLELTINGVVEAFRICHDGFSVERVVLDPAANEQFRDVCHRFGLAGDARTWNTMLFKLRKSGKLSKLKVRRQTVFAWVEIDAFFHASEMALQQLLNDDRAADINEVFCDPLIASEFDRLAEQNAPGQTALEYRWAALMVHQQTKVAKTRGSALTAPSKFGTLIPLQQLDLKSLDTVPGVYLLQQGNKTKLYAGETLNLPRRITSLQKTTTSDDLQIRIFPTQSTAADMLSWQSCFIKKHQPILNYRELAAL